MSSIRVLGVDPGIEGGLAVVDMRGQLLMADDIPTTGSGTKRTVSAALLTDLIAHWAPSTVCVELVAAMPRQGLSSTFRFGVANGTVVGVVGALKLPISFVAPGTWKRHFNLLGKPKEMSRVRAVEIWPAAASSCFARRKDVHRCEAGLIGLWAARTRVAAGSEEERS